jgi:hypothetical protein
LRVPRRTRHLNLAAGAGALASEENVARVPVRRRDVFVGGYIDVVLVLFSAPLLFLIGVPALGYGIGAAAWILLRGLGRAVDRDAGARANVVQQLALRVGYRLVRVLLLVTATVLALKGAGKSDGLTALLVITFAFTVQLIWLLFEGRGHREHRVRIPGEIAERDAHAEVPTDDVSAQPRTAA